MKKIITLFQRNYETDRLVRNQITPGAEWVIAGEGTATIKLDGTCCLVQDGKLYRRYELKKGKIAPPAFIAAQDPDPITGDTPGWLLVGGGNEDRWHREAFLNSPIQLVDWTYELVGPHVNGNPEKYDRDILIPHGKKILAECPRTFEELKSFLAFADIEGVVWWRDINDPNCEKVKIKKRDFGFKG